MIEPRLEALGAFRVPPNWRRLVHRWRDRQRVPDVKEVVRGRLASARKTPRTFLFETLRQAAGRP